MKKDTNLRERIEQILSETKWKQTTLSEQTGIPVQFFADCKRGKSKSISREYAEMIHNALPQYDIDWIIAGIAIDSPDTISPTNPTDAASTIQSMGINKDTDAASTKNALPGSVTELQSIIRQQAEMICQQQELITRLNREIDGLYERIDELKRATSIAAPHSVTAV